jgi:hypothetical protein
MGARSADTVVADLDREVTVVHERCHPRSVGLCVFGDVGERLGAEEVDARFHRGWKLDLREVELNPEGEASREDVQGRRKPPCREDRWVDPRGQLAQPLDSALCLPHGAADELLGLFWVCRPLLFGTLKVKEGVQEPLLRAVVQVARDPRPRRVARLDDPTLPSASFRRECPVDEVDPLRDEGEAYAAKLRLAGVPVTTVRYDGVVHDFMLLNAMSEANATRAAIAQATAFLRAALGTE